ncbi:glycoside hydrolase family 15 protein [Oceanibacterium hippocampi]|uniref:Trehalase n=1 Tax=Oceanibacterium hippocampi TaxID=745714 RepID=A0A1Y5TBS4_9PROT|nr:glycoside hydrolase family 15 protein [Oceanibacterium hippocampi]SLN58445.1 Trehalase [Oceanibacterium hippocampi]
MNELELGAIGNCRISALVDRRGRINWCCWPRLDSDPVFCDLLSGADSPEADDRRGLYEIALDGMVEAEQSYVSNTAILRTRLADAAGNAIEITDFVPRFNQFGRIFRPTMIVRQVRPVSGTPRITIRIRPAFEYGAAGPQLTHGSNHVRYVGPDETLRLTTNAPVAYVLDERPFQLAEPISLILGPDESLTRPVVETARMFEEQTESYWRNWVRYLYLPLEWQEAVIRAAITLKLCVFEETGAIIAAMTTSIPESPNSQRNWDYRFCWLRDAFFVVRALNRLGVVDIMEEYLRYLNNVTALADGGHLQPVYGIALEARLTERIVETLPGYRGMGPVRVGNQAHEHLQHDVYGDVVLAATQSFFDHRPLRRPGEADFDRLEKMGERAFRLHNEPDAGMWELRYRARVHTSSSLMCWAACDRLAKIAGHLGKTDRATYWRDRADEIHERICTEAWNEERQTFTESFGGTDIDASLLLMAEVGFVKADDPRFVKTVEAIEGHLLRDRHLMRYHAPDDFGAPDAAFNICTFWYVEALDMMGRREEAREIFEEMLRCRNGLGLLSEDYVPRTGELWGNFPQTYSLVGIINCAMRLSRSWGEVL